MTEKASKPAPPAEAPAVSRETDDDVRANETPVERARRLGQGDDVDPSIPTNQTPEQTAANIPPHDSNEELRIAGAKRGEADPAATRGQPGDKRGQTER